MGWTATTQTAAKIAARGLDKPLLLADTVMRLGAVGGTYQWRTSGSFASGSDGSDSSLPLSLLYDDFMHARSRPTSAANTWFVLMDLGVTTFTLDAVAIIKHTFGAIGGLTVTLEAADDNAYTVNLKTLATWSPGTSTKRLVCYALDHTAGGGAYSYTGGRYLRIKITKGSTSQPAIGEVVLGVSRQLQYQPDTPHDDQQLDGSDAVFTSASGISASTIHYKGRRILNTTLQPSDAAHIADLNSFFVTDTLLGSRRFVWCDYPTTTPQSAPLMKMAPTLGMPWSGPFTRDFHMSAEEQGDQFVALES